ncbi:response regulator [Paenibacillus eucommiae]|uniref:NarL family two-component system response regulator LiaR n=1 Tax=Paenibacillus eucommiae TaxID=1355755 RepID=A0ABS4IRX1_9BACL|nr:response regulator transcription factor [Paenibacillus eucommiae]MBP1990327.1 NarL family two-component system response regulator LiaR [Paenibacillus eucommiae]
MTNPPLIKIIMVEDDPDWVLAIAEFLKRETDMVLVGSASNPEEAVALAETTDFDVALLDIQLSPKHIDGIYTALEIARLRPQAKLIMLTSLQDEETIKKAFTAGAVGYLLKSNYMELPYAIRNAFHHAYPMEVLLKEFARLKEEEQLQQLTPAEKEIVSLIGDGYTRSQMEQKLYKSESTLKNQINRLLKKLGVKSGKEAVDKIKRKGL